MFENSNMTNTSPGIYSMDLVNMPSNSDTNDTVTKLGLVGETLKGPAFQPYWINSWDEYESVFGGTSIEKYKNTQYPKYELPYIAKEYLSTESSLCVVRTLGLSGYNAGPAWVITGKKSTESGSTKYVIAVLRSRGGYINNWKYGLDENGCDCKRSYDAISYQVGEKESVSGCTMPISYNMSAVTLDDYYVVGYTQVNECGDFKLSGTTDGFNVSYGNLGRFTIKCNDSNGNSVEIPVSLNKTDKDYILNVLGTSNDDGDTPLYVETFYHDTWEHMVNYEGYNIIQRELSEYNVENYVDYGGLMDINGVLLKLESELTRNDIGKRFIYNELSEWQYKSPSGVTYYEFDYKKNVPTNTTLACRDCHIYTVREIIENRKSKIVYSAYNERDIQEDEDLNYSEKVRLSDFLIGYRQNDNDDKHGLIVYNNFDNMFYANKDYGITPITCNLNDYKSRYRYSSTPWIVSNVKGSATNIEVNKLFRFHTISDGSNSQFEIKVSIENIKPDSGEFDVVVRKYYDNDYSPKVLERFVKCTMSEGTSSIEYQIGTIDGVFEGKSKYILVEVSDKASRNTNDVPCGFIGYPMPQYSGNTINGSGNTITSPQIMYNTKYNTSISKNKQYFGISDLTGYDDDYFRYKGNLATIEEPGFVTDCFHLDCRLNKESWSSGTTMSVLVDGVDGYVFNTVDIDSRTLDITENPIISSEENMVGSIYEDIRLRKFTVMFEGGFDGWDIYRSERSNTDKFSIQEYKGYIDEHCGIGYSIDNLKKSNTYGIEGKALTSDYYSTIAALSLLKNNNDVEINLLATPGIDAINNTGLIKEVFDLIDDRQDTFYIVTTPDKNVGFGDYDDFMITPEDVADMFERKDLFSDNAATFYPWIKIEDNGGYIWIPPTSNIVRDIAQNDNMNSTMSIAPAGVTNGKINGIRARKNLTAKESDVLYKERINPIKTMNQNGIYNMGQKTLRKVEDIMSRINVRRMVLQLRKTISEECKKFLFEPIDENLSIEVRSAISGVMNSFLRQGAIEKWNMNVNSLNEQRDNAEINCSIYLMPVRSLEYISLNFILTNSDVYFQD